MTLGIIVKEVNEAAFAMAAEKGLDFVEFCINGGNDGSELFDHMDEVKGWMEKYDVFIGSIGRWKSDILLPDGTINPFEIDMAKKLMNAAAELGCTNYICGCNYIDALSLYDNVTRAIEWFQIVLDACPEGIQVSSYNCRKMNFVNTPEMWRLIHGHLPELGIKYDPSHARYDGADYLKEVSDWGERIHHVHLKGSMIVNGEKVDDPPAGLDDTNWPVFLSILRARGYDGTLSIEPHSPVWSGELGDKGTDYTIEYFKKLLFR
jgi:sugar phosphate isomerase/epimerase